MTQQNKSESEARLFPAKSGGKLDETFPDGVGKTGEPQAVITDKSTSYDYSERVRPAMAEVAQSMAETARYGGHGIAARAAGIDVPADSDNDGDYDTPRDKGGA